MAILPKPLLIYAKAESPDLAMNTCRHCLLLILPRLYTDALVMGLARHNHPSNGYTPVDLYDWYRKRPTLVRKKRRPRPTWSGQNYRR